MYKNFFLIDRPDLIKIHLLMSTVSLSISWNSQTLLIVSLEKDIKIK